MEKYDGLFRIDTDYKATFKALVDSLIKEPLSLSDRIGAVEDLINAYVEQTGSRPDGYHLMLLANYILSDVLKDKSPDKVSNNEFPILTKRQIKLRKNKEKKLDESLIFYCK